MKKNYLFLMMAFLLVFPSTMKADELTVYDGGFTFNQNVPVNGVYANNYLRCQFIIPAGDLATMSNSEIQSLTFSMLTAQPADWTGTFQVYMTELDYTSISSFVASSSATTVYTGALPKSNNQLIINFDTPYLYSGGNLMVGIDCIEKGTVSSGALYFGTNVAGASISGYHATSLSSVAPTQCNFIPKTTLVYQPAPPAKFVAEPALDLGYRPNGYWMAPFVSNIINNGPTTEIDNIDVTNNFFTVGEMELPITVDEQGNFPIEISTGTTAAGNVNAQLVIFNNYREANMVNMKAIAYDPVTPDVWELAQNVTSFPFTQTYNAPSVPLRNNYTLPGTNADGPDAVYKVTFTDDILLNVNVTGGNPKAVVYAEDFNGEAGPGIDNALGMVAAPQEFFEGFESGDFSAYDWTNDPAYPWTVTADAYEGSYCAKSGNANAADTESGITLNYNVPEDGYIMFYWKASCEGMFYDYPKFYIDGVLKSPAYCSQNGFDWTQAQFEVTAGTHSFKWSYIKDYMSNYGSDCLWVDNISFGTESSRAVTENIADMMVPAGTYYIVASSTSNDFTVNINTAQIPLPEPAVCVSPADGSTNVTSPVTLSWEFGQYTTQYQLLMGTVYPPSDVMVDWTTDLATSYTTAALLNNKNYFWQVNVRNSSGITYGEKWGFVTPLNIPQNLTAADNELFVGETAELSWQPVNDRSYRGYNVYQDGVKINAEVITATSYTVSGLPYNMNGYEYNVTAVYDEGESEFTNTVTVSVSGNGMVSGVVYEQDGTTAVEDATVTFNGTDEFGDAQTFEFTTGTDGSFNGEILAGYYEGIASKDGFQDAPHDGSVNITYNNETSNIVFYMSETYTPLGEVIAEEIDENMVKVYWSWDLMNVYIEDFETGDFTANPWDNTVTPNYPWTITTANPYEGAYCMKSTGEGVDNLTSSIQITVDVPYTAVMSFYQFISSEENYDKGHFYIDNVEMTSISGSSNWSYKEFNVAEGEHTYKWSYIKDGSVNSGSDYYAVDYVTFHREPEPWPGEGWIYYDDGINVDAVGLTEGGSFWWGIMFPSTSLQQYGNFSLSKVAYFDYSAHTGNILIYEGGDAAPGTLVYTQPYTAGGTNEYIEFDFTTPFPVDNSKNLWIVMNNTTGQYVAAAGNKTDDPNGRWISIDGTTWMDVAFLGLNYTWNLRGYVTTTRGQVLSLANDNIVNEITYEGQSTPGGILTTDPGAKTTVTNFGKNMKSYDRSLCYYNVYRTDCYNTDYSAENLTVLASHVTDTVYMDMSWGTTEPGVYKWGVSAYYEGNRDNGNRAAWDLVNSFPLSYIGEQGVVTDGNFIYTCSWMGYPNSFNKYSMDGTFIEGFNIDGAYGIYDLTYDGQYFYGGAGASTIYTIDLANKALIGTTNTGVSEIRHCSYDPANNGFWIGNWTDLYLVNRSGSVIRTAPSPQRAYGSGYFTDTDGKAHLYLFCQPNSDAKVYDYDITANTISSSPIFDFVNLPGFNNASACGAFVGVYQGKNCFFGNVMQMPNMLGIYELSVAEVPGPTGSAGESPITWSNCLDKDMFTSVDVNVTTNSSDAPTGTSVSFVNVSEPELELSYEVVLDETGIYTWNEFRKGTYTYTITLEGFNSCAENETIEIWDPTSIECSLEEIINKVGRLYVSPTGWAMWDNSGTTLGDEFTVDFENGIPEGWTMIDADGDGNNWLFDDGTLGGVAHQGIGYITSASFNYNGPLYPDNYIVSPKVALGNDYTFSFYVSAYHEWYAAEHYGVAISTNGNTNPEDFTTIWEETLVAKGSKNGREDVTRQGNWYYKTIDLSAYVGQQVYIAIRHFDCSDKYRINVDDVVLAAADRNNESLEFYKVMLDGNFITDVTTPYYQHDVTNLVEGQEYTTSVAAVYSTGMSEWNDCTWTYVPCENYVGVTDLAAETVGSDAVITWTMPGGGPTPPPSGGDTFFYNFEDATMSDWTTIDADGDGKNWVLGSAPGTSGNNGSNYCVYSQSYDSAPLNPDNYLVSKQVTIGSGATFEFYAAAQDASYAAEHYGVAISTSGNTNAADFTTIWEETMTAKGQQGGPRGNRVQGTWYHKSIDLSAYAGQQVYIAIRHFNCTDMFYLDVDDIELTCASKATLDGTWLSYDDGTFVDGIGTGGSELFWAVMFPSNMMSAYEGYSMTKVNMYDREAFTGDVMVYQGGATAPGTLVYTQEVTMNGTSADVDIVLNEAVALDVTQNVWVVMHCDFASHPASAGTDTGDPNGRWISLDGSEWMDAASAGVPGYCWTLRAYVEEGTPVPPTPTIGIVGSMVFRDGVCLTPTPVTFATYTDVAPGAGEHKYCVRVVYGEVEYGENWYAMSCPECTIIETECAAPSALNGTYTWNDASYGVTLSWTSASAPENFKIYRSTTNGNYQEIAEVAGTVNTYFDDCTNSPDVYYYQVTAVYASGCESAPAQSALNPADNYVMVEVTNVIDNNIDNVRIYPNPTNDKLNIEAAGMTRITVTTVLGQVMSDQTVESDNEVLDMNQYGAGIYMVRIVTENGTMVKRITVID